MTTPTNRSRTLVAFARILAGILALAATPAFAADATPKPLIDFAAPSAEKRVTTTPQVTVARSADAAAPGLVVNIATGAEGYPGITIVPADNAPLWDLSAFGHIEARIVNTGTKPLGLTLRIDNDGDWKTNPWNGENGTIKPGEAGIIKIIFGHSFGFKPAYALKPDRAARILLFTGKLKDPVSFRLESVVAAGPAGEKPAIDPRSIRTKPKAGVILGAGVTIDPAKQIEATNGAEAALVPAGDTSALRITFAKPKGEPAVKFKPAIGRWDLRDCLEIRVTARNAGPTPITPRIRVESDGGATEWVTAAAPLAPGASQELVANFVNPVPWQGIKNSGDRTSWNGQPNTGTRFSNDAVSAVVLSAAAPDPSAALVIESIRAALPPAPILPDWVGKRPPVDGDWKLTFNEDFNGAAVDLAKWNNTGPNYWDKTSRWSKDNVIVKDGVARIRYEKRAGPNNDDPKEKVSQYTSGYLDTYGKWVQRYGYFETRTKLPTAPGLWPAFWVMPDRGEAVGPQWKRQDTGNGGMELDVMESLTRWGPNRYNIAMHWDGYGKEHKQTGTTMIYVQPDKDGFITSGVLWAPGLIVFYGNGREVARWEADRVGHVVSNLMFTLPMGGWDNNAVDDAQLPADFVIDYVRAWQRADLASKVDGPVPATRPAAN